MASEVGPIMAALRVVQDSQQRMEGALSKLVADQHAVADAVGACASERWQSSMASPRTSLHGEAEDEEEAMDLDEAAAAAVAMAESNRRQEPTGFLGKIAEAEARIGKENILKPSEAKAFLEANPQALFLDVQDSDASTIPGVYRASLGQLYFKASSDLPDFRDPAIADRDREAPILVTCGLGGQAKLGAKLLLDYGFTNVKTVDGGCLAWQAFSRSHPAFLPMNWPASVSRRSSFLEDCGEGSLQEASAPLRRGYSRARSGVQALESLPVMGRRFTTSGSTSTFSAVTGQDARFVMAPSSVPRVTLDIISVFILVFDVITVPWILAWDVKVEGWLKTSSMIMVSFWTMEIVFSFRTGYYEQGEVRMNLGMIAKRYIKTWFIPDLVMVLLDWASVVLLIIEEFGTDSQEADNRLEIRMMGILRFTKWSRALRLLSMVRFVRFSDVFERLMDRSYYLPNFLVGWQVVRIIFFIAYVNHVGACIWWGIGNQAISGNRWVDLDVDETGLTYIQADPLHQYVVSLHWAMTQILAGSMQVNSTNVAEHLFTVFCLVFGVLILSSVVSTLSSKMTQLKMMNQDKTTKIAQLREFLQRKAVGTELAVNVVKQVDESLKEQRKPLTMNQLLVWNTLSQRNKNKLHEEMCRPPLLQHPFFLLMNHIEAKLIKTVCDKALSINVHSPHETVFTAGTEAHKMYAVLDGCMKYTQDPDTSMVALEEETRVWKGTWISEAALWTHWMHVGTLESQSVCELLVLKASAVAEVLQRNICACQIAGEYCRAFHARVHGAKPPEAEWPSDLSVPYASFREIMSTMNRTVMSYVGLLALQNTAHLSWSPWQHRLREDVREGRCAAVPSTSGDVDVLTSSVTLQLDRMDGRVLVRLGTWDGRAAIPACSLPGTRQRAGELPRMAFRRLLRTQLQPFADLVQLQGCSSEVQVKTEFATFNRWTMVTKHAASLVGQPPCLPMANSGVAPSTTLVSRTHSISSKFDIDEIFVVAGTAEQTTEEEEDAPVVQLLSWLEPAVLDLLCSQSGQGKLKRSLAAVEVSQAAVEEAFEMYDAQKLRTSAELSGRFSNRTSSIALADEGREEKEEEILC